MVIASFQVVVYNETVQENIRQGNIAPPTPAQPVSSCEGSFSTAEFVLFIVGAFVCGILGTSFVLMWMLNLRRISEKEEESCDDDEVKRRDSEESNEDHI